MAEPVERVVTELIAKVDGFDGKIKTSATAFDGSMKKIEQSATSAENTTGKSMGAVAAATERAGKAANSAGKEWVRASSEAGKLRQAQLGQAAAADRAAASTELATRATNRNAQSSRLLGYQISDIGTQLASGSSPFLILAQQGPQVANALDGAGGAVGRFATFLSTWQGALVLAGATLAGTFIPKLLEAGDSVDDLVKKLQEQARKTADADKANELFGRTIEGVTKALNDNEDALDKLKGAQDTGAEAALRHAEAQAREAITIQTTTKSLLEQAIAREELSRSIGVLPGTDPAAAAISQQQANARVVSLQAKLKEIDAQIIRAGQQIIEAQSLISVDRGTASKEDQITRQYERRIEDARKLAVAQGKVGAELERQVKTLRDARDAEIKRIRDAESERKKTGAGLPKVTGQEVARLLGAPITSGTRTAAQNKAAGGADNSYHLSGQAIDIPLTINGKPLTKAGIRAALEPAGVIIKELLGPGDKGHNDHFHIAFDKKRAGPDQVRNSQEKLAEEAARQAEEELRRRQSFENELANMQGSELDARQALVAAAEEIARLEVEAIKISRDKYDDNLNSLVEQKKLTAEEAAELRKLNDERAKLRTELVQRREDQRKFRMAEADAERKLEFQSQSYAIEEELLQSREGIAKTSKERRDLEGKLINLQFDEERLQNDAIIAKAERLRIELERLATMRELSDAEKDELERARNAATVAEGRNGTLGERRGNAQTGNDRANAGPLQDWMNSVPQTADEINESFESIAAGGLTSLSDGIADAIVNFKSLGDVARAVVQSMLADIAKLIIKMLILKAIKAIFGMADGGGVGGIPSTGQGASVQGLTAGGLARGGPAGFPGGGPVSGPGTWTSDSIPARLSNGEYVIKARSAAKLGRRALDRMNLTGEMPGFADGGLVVVRPSNAAASAARERGAGMDEAALRRIEAAVERGAASQPDVNLYPTLQPKQAMAAMLADPGAQRMLFGFLSDNSGRANSSLRR